MVHHGNRYLWQGKYCTNMGHERLRQGIPPEHPLVLSARRHVFSAQPNSRRIYFFFVAAVSPRDDRPSGSLARPHDGRHLEGVIPGCSPQPVTSSSGERDPEEISAQHKRIPIVPLVTFGVENQPSYSSPSEWAPSGRSNIRKP